MHLNQSLSRVMLRGPNHLSAVNLNFNVCNVEKDDSRAHSSIFTTNSTMTGVDQSDLLNKILVSSNDGIIMLSRSNDTKAWSLKHKNKLINYSCAVQQNFQYQILEICIFRKITSIIKFKQICRFNVIPDVEQTINNKQPNQITYNSNLGLKASMNKIEIQLERITNQASRKNIIFNLRLLFINQKLHIFNMLQKRVDLNQMNPIGININSLNKVVISYTYYF